MVASRQFIEMVGPLREDYFLYYEEVDWAFRRGGLPLRTCPEAVVHHHGGTSIGTGDINRRASAFANYFNFRNRLRFLARFAWPALPVAYVYSMAQIARLVLTGSGREAVGALRGLHQLRPPREVADRIAPEAAELAFGRWGRQK
jgi:GT2 family glycosyltransferase